MENLAVVQLCSNTENMFHYFTLNSIVLFIKIT